MEENGKIESGRMRIEGSGDTGAKLLFASLPLVIITRNLKTLLKAIII